MLILKLPSITIKSFNIVYSTAKLTLPLITMKLNVLINKRSEKPISLELEVVLDNGLMFTNELTYIPLEALQIY